MSHRYHYLCMGIIHFTSRMRVEEWLFGCLYYFTEYTVIKFHKVMQLLWSRFKIQFLKKHRVNYLNPLSMKVYKVLIFTLNIKEKMCLLQAFDLFFRLQSTLPKSNSHKSNNRLSRRSIQVLFSLYSIVFNPSQVKFSLSGSYFFSPNRFDLGRVDCICSFLCTADVL